MARLANGWTLDQCAGTTDWKERYKSGYNLVIWQPASRSKQWENGSVGGWVV